ncbi:MAG: hypothetical protein IPK79_09955 [Vampirovibrionales bacterium]|nr:hypothetical protein [Vampirovibrionales bacterium]
MALSIRSIRFGGTAGTYPESLAGRTVTIDWIGGGADFGEIYPQMKGYESFTIIADPDGPPSAFMVKDGVYSPPRVVKFQTEDGKLSDFSAAERFDVVI